MEFPYFQDNPTCVYPGDYHQCKGWGYPLLTFGKGKLGVIPTVRFWEKRDVFFDAEDSGDARVQIMMHSPRVVFEGWNFRSRLAIIKFREQIRTVFAPRENVLAAVERQKTFLKERADVVVGVHIRWGDYRETDMYFELSEYVDRMNQVRSLLAPAKVAFLVCSPEKIPEDAFPDNCVVSSAENPLEDMYALAECQYIIGPPSTFSMWASYYGGAGLFVMRAGEQFIDESQARMATP